MLILTYHAVEAHPGSLCIDPARLAAHLDEVAESGRPVLTVSEIAAALADGALTAGAVAITFDDGFDSVADRAAPLLLERGLRATVFCVAGHLGAHNDWPTQAPGAPRRRLADAGELRELAIAGFELGSHGMTHLPLRRATERELHRELVDSRLALEDAVQAPVTSFAYPYGETLPRSARPLLECTYEAACTTRIGAIDADSDRFALPRVDAHYVRRAGMVLAAADGHRHSYLRIRGVAARARRVARPDYARPQSQRS
jgi:peptidoglycan/xylan/chitin deacetylase (PgdA/CDA1 family)